MSTNRRQRENSRQRQPSRAFSSTSGEELAALFEAVALQVNYVDYREEITAEKFRRLVNIVVWDTYWELTDEDISRQLGCSEQTVKRLRKDPQYKSIKFDVETAFERVTSGSYADMVANPEFQRRLFLESSRLAFHAKDLKVQERMIATLTDRVKAKLYDRAQVGPQVLVLQGPHVEVLTAALEEAKQLPTVDAEYSEVQQANAGGAAGKGKA